MEDYNSIKNQEIKRKFVDREVLTCVSTLIEYGLKQEGFPDDKPFSWDDVENLYYYEDENGNCYLLEEKEWQLEQWREELEEAEDKLAEESENGTVLSRISALENDIEDLENAEERMNEIYEWWIVTGWLGKKLGDYGEPVVTDGLNYYWGRCTTGQAILLDYVISRICEEPEILEGQANTRT